MAKLKAAIAAAALAGGLAVAGSALAQAGITPPDWQILLRCAEIGDGDQRLACYDQAMRAAGYAPKPEVVAEEKRKRFGLSVPKLNILKHDDQKRTEVAGQAAPAPAASAPPPPPPKEDDDTVTVQLERVAVLYGNKLLLITTEGAIWEQISSEVINIPPKPGQTITIRRTRFRGYFCDLNKWSTIRCERTH